MRAKPNQVLSALAIPRITAHVDPEVAPDARWVLELDFEWRESIVVLDGTCAASEILRAFGVRFPNAAPIAIVEGLVEPDWMAPWTPSRRIAPAALATTIAAERPAVVMIASSGTEIPLQLASLGVRVVVIAPHAIDEAVMTMLAEIGGGYAIIEPRATNNYYATALFDVSIELAPIAAEIIGPHAIARPTLRAEGEALVVETISSRPEDPAFVVHVRGRAIDLPVTCGGFALADRASASAPSEALVARVRDRPAPRIPSHAIVEPLGDDDAIAGEIFVRVLGTDYARRYPLARRQTIDAIELRVDDGELLVRAPGALRNGAKLGERAQPFDNEDIVELGELVITVERRAIGA